MRVRVLCVKLTGAEWPSLVCTVWTGGVGGAPAGLVARTGWCGTRAGGCPGHLPAAPHRVAERQPREERIWGAPDKGSEDAGGRLSPSHNSRSRTRRPVGRQDGGEARRAHGLARAVRPRISAIRTAPVFEFAAGSKPRSPAPKPPPSPAPKAPRKSCAVTTREVPGTSAKAQTRMMGMPLIARSDASRFAFILPVRDCIGTSRKHSSQALLRPGAEGR